MVCFAQPEADAVSSLRYSKRVQSPVGMGRMFGTRLGSSEALHFLECDVQPLVELRAAHPRGII